MGTEKRTTICNGHNRSEYERLNFTSSLTMKLVVKLSEDINNKHEEKGDRKYRPSHTYGE